MTFLFRPQLLGLLFGLLGSTASHGQNLLVNGSFDQNLTGITPAQTFSDTFSNPLSPAIASFEQADILGWQTTSTLNGNGAGGIGEIEIWRNGALGVPSFDAIAGTQFAEINAYDPAELFQIVTVPLGDLVDYVFYHRGRNGTDVLRFTITDVESSVVLVDILSSAGNSFWSLVAGNDVFVSDGGQYRLGFAAVSAAGGPSVGNFLDAQAFGEGVADIHFIPEPSSSLTLLVSLGAFVIRRKR